MTALPLVALMINDRMGRSVPRTASAPSFVRYAAPYHPSAREAVHAIFEGDSASDNRVFRPAANHFINRWNPAVVVATTSWAVISLTYLMATTRLSK